MIPEPELKGWAELHDHPLGISLHGVTRELILDVVQQVAH
jgi:hypothetical protein